MSSYFNIYKFVSIVSRSGKYVAVIDQIPSDVTDLSFALAISYVKRGHSPFEVKLVKIHAYLTKMCGPH